MELKEIIKMVKDSCSINLIAPSNDMILDCSVRIFNSNNINGAIQKEELATEKQKNLIYKLNLDVNTEKITKQEAYNILKENLPKKKR